MDLIGALYACAQRAGRICTLGPAFTPGHLWTQSVSHLAGCLHMLALYAVGYSRESLSSNNAAHLLQRVEDTADSICMTAAVISKTTSPLRIVLPPTHPICQTGCFAASAVCLLRSSLQECCCLACVLLLICTCGTALNWAHNPCSINSNPCRRSSLARRRFRDTAGCSKITATVT